MKDRPLTPDERWLRDELAADGEAQAAEMVATDFQQAAKDDPKFVLRTTPIAPLD